MSEPYEIRRMAGPCWNGSEGNGGTRWHAMSPGNVQRAICGARCKSFWSDAKGPKVTCPRCLARIVRAAPAAGGTRNDG